MPRNPRAAQGGLCYHVLNGGNARRAIFRKGADFAAFVKLMRQAEERTPLRLLAYCLMPNHFHLALWPRGDGDLSDYMRWPWSSAAAGAVEHVNAPQTEAELEALRECIRRRRPYGETAWAGKAARQLGLEASLRPRGRPRKTPAKESSLFDRATEED